MSKNAGARGARLASSVLALLCTGQMVSCASETVDAGDGGGAGGAASGGTNSGGNNGSGGRSSGGSPAATGGVPSQTGGVSTSGGEGGLGGASGGSSGSGGGSGGSPEPALYVSTALDLTDESEVDYPDNEHGIISGGTLASWLEDWSGNRPAHIDGDLIILQVVPASVTSFSNLPENPDEGVYSYLVSANSFNVARDSGFSYFETDIPDGATADAWFERYDVDPNEDLVVLVFEQQGSTQNSVVHSIGRAWLFLKYWGISSEHLAILNGSLNWNASTYGFQLDTTGSHTFSDPPNNGTARVRDTGVDNTVLSVSLEEVISLLDERAANPTVDDGVRIVDARGGAEAYGLAKATSTGRTNCASYTGTAPNAKCSTPLEGRIKGAGSVPWTQFLDTAQNGFRFLPKAQVKAIFDAQAGWDDDANLTIQYCRTNQRSTVTGIVANTILGYPTRLYETSFIEWGHASAGPEETGLGGAGSEDYPNKRLVAADFAFRTDLEHLTEHAVLHPDDAGAYVPGGTLGTLTQPVTWVDGPNYNTEADIAPAVEGVWPKLHPDAATTRQSIDQDRAYLRGISVEELASGE